MKQVAVGLLLLSGIVLSWSCDFIQLIKNAEFCNVQYDKQLELLRQQPQNDSMELICCSAKRWAQCVQKTSPNETCLRTVEDFLDRPLLNRPRANGTFCEKSNYTVCDTPECRQHEFNVMEKECQREYDSDIIHIIEDPTITNKSATMCCALSRKGHCLLEAVSSSQCFNQEIVLEQPAGLREAYGICFSFELCSGSQGIQISLAFTTMLLIIGRLLAV